MFEVIVSVLTPIITGGIIIIVYAPRGTCIRMIGWVLILNVIGFTYWYFQEKRNREIEYLIFKVKKKTHKPQINPQAFLK